MNAWMNEWYSVLLLIATESVYTVFIRTFFHLLFKRWISDFVSRVVHGGLPHCPIRFLICFFYISTLLRHVMPWLKLLHIFRNHAVVRCDARIELLEIKNKVRRDPFLIPRNSYRLILCRILCITGKSRLVDVNVGTYKFILRIDCV